MKRTLLEIVQDMLSALDAEDIESISDTTEAGQCVNIANRCYEEMITSRRNWRHLKQYTSLQTSTLLNELVTPPGCLAIDPYNIWYNNKIIHYVSPTELIGLTITREGSNIQRMGYVNVYTDREPLYFTSDDDEHLIFDAVPNAIDGLNGNLVTAIAYIMPSSRLTADDQVFDLPAIAFPALEKFCIGQALLELKDPNIGAAMIREYKNMLKILCRTARLIDTREDVRKWIIPRKTSRGLINVGVT